MGPQKNCENYEKMYREYKQNFIICMPYHRTSERWDCHVLPCWLNFFSVHSWDQPWVSSHLFVTELTTHPTHMYVTWLPEKHVSHNKYLVEMWRSQLLDTIIYRHVTCERLEQDTWLVRNVCSAVSPCLVFQSWVMFSLVELLSGGLVMSRWSCEYLTMQVLTQVST